MTEYLKKVISDKYEKQFEGYDVPEAIRLTSSIILFQFGINGICDGMYICNTIAAESGIGNGTGEFFGSTDQINAEKSAKAIQSAYSSTIPNAYIGVLEQIISGEELNEFHMRATITKLIEKEKEDKSKCRDEWRMEYLEKRIQYLKEIRTILTEDITRNRKMEKENTLYAHINLNKKETEQIQAMENGDGQNDMRFSTVFSDGTKIEIVLHSPNEESKGQAWSETVLFIPGAEPVKTAYRDEFCTEWNILAGEKKYGVILRKYSRIVKTEEDEALRNKIKNSGYPENLLYSIALRCATRNQQMSEIIDLADNRLNESETKLLEKSINNLPLREGVILFLHFKDRYSYQDIGSRFGLSRERIRILIGRALRDLYHSDLFSDKIHGRVIDPMERTQGTSAAGKITISELDLSVRAYNCLRRAGMNTLEEIANHTEEDLLNIRNFGRTTLVEVKLALAKYGMSLLG